RRPLPDVAERELGTGVDVRRQLAPGAGEDRQYEETDLAERADRPHRLDRLRPTDEVDVAAGAHLLEALEQARRVGLDHDMVGRARGPVAGEDEHGSVAPRPVRRADRGFE